MISKSERVSITLLRLVRDTILSPACTGEEMNSHRVSLDPEMHAKCAAKVSRIANDTTPGRPSLPLPWPSIEMCVRLLVHRHLLCDEGRERIIVSGQLLHLHRVLLHESSGRRQRTGHLPHRLRGLKRLRRAHLLLLCETELAVCLRADSR